MERFISQNTFASIEFPARAAAAAHGRENGPARLPIARRTIRPMFRMGERPPAARRHERSIVTSATQGTSEGGVRMERLKGISKALALVAGAWILAAGMAGAAFAQDSRGTITGTVRDSSKGVVPGATVTITSAAMGNAITTVTNEDGY